MNKAYRFSYNDLARLYYVKAYSAKAEEVAAGQFIEELINVGVISSYQELARRFKEIRANITIEKVNA